MRTRVHLLKSEEVDQAAYHEILQQLQLFSGPLEFVSTVDEPVFEDDEGFEFVNSDEIGRDTSHSLPDEMLHHEICYSINEISYSEKAYYDEAPQKLTRLKWDDIFDRCKSFRLKNDISEFEFVILLTDKGNEFNWFAAPNPKGGRDGFVQTSGLGFYLPGFSRASIVYLIVTHLLRHLMFSSIREMSEGVHQTSVGCMNDFCGNKSELILKIRTADLCSDCVKRLEDKQVDPLLANQVFEIMEATRSEILFRDRYSLLKKPSRMSITGPNYKIQFPDLANIELKLDKIEKTTYLFFLGKPEGVKLNMLDEHREELTELYLKVSPTSTRDTAAKRINERTDNTNTQKISETISKIRRKINDLLGNEMAEHYIISGANGELKKIGVDRNLVSFLKN
ncbi:MAG: hypothetical protein RLZZ91_373 [Bacteroidota bacterium]